MDAKITDDGKALLRLQADLERAYDESDQAEKDIVDTHIAQVRSLIDQDQGGRDHMKAAIALLGLRLLLEDFKK